MLKRECKEASGDGCCMAAGDGDAALASGVVGDRYLLIELMKRGEEA